MIGQQEPLTPEERELAAQLSRLGPHGEPSPALDSRVLAAAHAALAEPGTGVRKPRWPVALGLAASVLLAVGVAWQLRPLQEAPTASEAPSAAAAAPELDTLPEPVQTQAADAAAPAPVQKSVSPPTESNPPPSAPPQRPSRQAALPPAPRAVARDQPAAPDAFQREPAPAERYSPPPPPPAPSAPAPVMAQKALGDAGRTAAQAEQAAQAKRARDDATSSRQLLLESEMRRRQESPTAAASAIAHDTVVEATGSARATLRRTDLQLPVAEDAKLAPEEWLDRIRLRRDLGDSGNASASLRLFVEAHPFQRVPEDLRPLIVEE